mgnify:CR=1|jgi:hypothetical protein
MQGDSTYRIVDSQQFRQAQRGRPGRALAWLALGLTLGLIGAAHAPRLNPVPAAEAAPQVDFGLPHTAWCQPEHASLSLSCTLR